ncbi:MAG: phosphatase PAP2 family protein [Alistipes sp.]|jgi:undecaprenyl-diphosphatase|nr:phosphatase PAP2 family protein [Alistipes sp.]
MYNNIDYPLFLWLNFDGGAVMDKAMLLASTPAVWAWLYVIILYMVWRKNGWRGIIIFLVAAALAVTLGDMISGIFKHTGVLKNLLPSFPARLRPMYTPELEGMVSNILRQGGQYGTVSGHAATMVSMAVLAIPAVGRRWFTVLMTAVVLVICYSRIYLAYHFPIDIALGAVTGLVSGGVMLVLYKYAIHRWCKNG